jgi:hypothetical protein
MNVHRNDKGPYNTMAPKSNSTNKAHKRNTQNTILRTQCFLISSLYTSFTLLPCHSGAPSISFYNKASSLQPWQCGRPPGICLHSVAASYLLQPTTAAIVLAYKQPAPAAMPHVLSSYAHLKCTNSFLCFPQPSTMISQPVHHKGQASKHI